MATALTEWAHYDEADRFLTWARSVVLGHAVQQGPPRAPSDPAVAQKCVNFSEHHRR